MKPDRSFLSELRRRKVYETGVAYVVGGLAVWGAADFAAGAFFWPESVLQIVVIATLGGFPIALLAAWLFVVHLSSTSKVMYVHKSSMTYRLAVTLMSSFALSMLYSSMKRMVKFVLPTGRKAKRV